MNAADTHYRDDVLCLTGHAPALDTLQPCFATEAVCFGVRPLDADDGLPRGGSYVRAYTRPDGSTCTWETAFVMRDGFPEPAMNAAALAERRALYAAIDRASSNHLAARPQIDPPVHYGPSGAAVSNDAIWLKDRRDPRWWNLFDLHQPPHSMQWRRAVVDDFGTLVVVGVAP